MRYFGCFLLDKIALAQTRQQAEIRIVFQSVTKSLDTEIWHGAENSGLAAWIEKVAFPIVTIAERGICPDVAFRVTPVHRRPIQESLNLVPPVQPKRQSVVQ